MDITEGGDMQRAKPFATGLKGPASILPLKDGKLLISEMWGGRVTDIAEGGDFSEAKPFVDDLSGPYSLCRIIKKDGDHLYVTQSFNGRDSWVSEITDGKLDPERIVDNIPVKPGHVGITPIESWPDRWQKFALGNCVKNWETDGISGKRHFLAISDLGQVLEITDAQGDYMTLVKEKRAVAWGLDQVGAMKPHPKNDLIYITQPCAGNVMAINPDSPKNYHFDAPVVKGFKYPSCIRFSPDGETMYACDQADGVVWRITDFQ